MTRIFALALAGLVLLVVLGVPDPPEAAAANQGEPSMRRGGEPSMRPEHGKGLARRPRRKGPQGEALLSSS